MSDTNSPAAPRLPLEPMDPQLRCEQPGGGIVIQLELTWGKLRRWYLRTFRAGYVAKMKTLRQGEPAGVPHEVLDPRDLKFFRNQTNCHWKPEEDPFRWRDRLPFARVGLAELVVLTVVLLGPAVLLTVLAAGEFVTGAAAAVCYLLAGGLALCGLEVLWFFRNPHRQIPIAPGMVVSPADGKVVHIAEIPHDEFLGGPAIEIGIFLSIFNVHINRAPVEARVIGLTYRKGKFLNALRPESARENEQLAIRLEENAAPYRRMIVRQITGAIARRIVCWLKPGDELARGEQFGMIKLGSRTELVLPREPGLELLVREGATVIAGESVLAQYKLPAGQKSTGAS